MGLSSRVASRDIPVFKYASKLGPVKRNARFSYSSGHRLLEVVGIALFLGVALYLSGRIFLAVETPPDLLMIGAAAGLGFLVADIMSGLVHWSADTLWGENTPLIGRHFIRPFREHHSDPKAITRHDFIETNGNNCLASMLILGPVAVVLPEEEGIGFHLCATAVFMCWSLFATNQFHKWAHADRAPRFVRVLQRWHLILPPTHHDIHHRAPHDRHYCITVGWMNPVLARMRFFRALEWMVCAMWPRIMSPHATSRRQAARIAAASARLS